MRTTGSIEKRSEWLIFVKGTTKIYDNKTFQLIIDKVKTDQISSLRVREQVMGSP